MVEVRVLDLIIDIQFNLQVPRTIRAMIQTMEDVLSHRVFGLNSPLLLTMKHSNAAALKALELLVEHSRTMAAFSPDWVLEH